MKLFDKLYNFKINFISMEGELFLTIALFQVNKVKYVKERMKDLGTDKCSWS